MAVSADIFRRVLGRFATGVTVITLKNKDGIHGLTVNAFASVSLQPPLVLICIQKNGISHACMAEADSFVVNILGEEQIDLAKRFADSNLNSHERFENVSYRVTRQGVPILDGNLGHLECNIVNQFDGGDHTIFLGQVEEAEAAKGGRPLLYYESQYCHL
jgi:flavin reductase (DIM6/NTAB) family NADH-FMN oxidoreductase RutF